MTTRISLPVDPRMTSGALQNRDQLWVTDNGVIYSLQIITSTVKIFFQCFISLDVSDLNISIETRMHQINVYISHNSRFCFTRNYKKEMIRNLFNISPSVMEKSRNIIFIIHLVCRYVLSTINSFICFTTTSKHFNIYFFLLRHFSYNQLFYFFVKLRYFFLYTVLYFITDT